MTDLTTLTVVEIDTLWAPLRVATVTAYWAEVDAREAARVAQEKLDGKRPMKKYVDYTHNLERAVAYWENNQASLHAAWVRANEAEAPFEAEWDRRGGWTRAYLVLTTGGGHVHRSTHCSTCYPTTRFEWLISESGKDEAEIVELAGERACTVCFDSAPVAVLSRPTRLFGQEEIARQQEKAAKEAAKAAKKAEEIVVENYHDHSSHTHTHVFKTVRGATNAIAGNLSSLCFYGTSHPSAPHWLSDIQAVRDALAAKGVEYDYDKALASARKKTASENKKYGNGREVQF